MTAEQNGFQKSGDSVHAYDREGNPRHSVPYKDKKRAGEMRPTTLRDIKENGWLPSVSSILSIMEKKGLDKWKKEQVAIAAAELRDQCDLDNADWIEWVLKGAEANMTKARDLGTEIHGAIEWYLSFLQTNHPVAYHCQDGLVPLSRHSRCVEAAVAALKELGVWGQPFEAEKTFASNFGYGGTIDFSTDCLIVDFKCLTTLKKRFDYPDRAAQIAAYQMGRFKKLCRGVNIMIATDDPGSYALREWSLDELEYGWSMFDACFSLWRIVNKYHPASSSYL